MMILLASTPQTCCYRPFSLTAGISCMTVKPAPDTLFGAY